MLIEETDLLKEFLTDNLTGTDCPVNTYRLGTLLSIWEWVYVLPIPRRRFSNSIEL